MAPIDQRGRLEEDVFTYRQTKDQKIFLYWEGRQIKTLAGKEAIQFIKRIEGLEGVEAQLVMAKATGHFKHGNEKGNQEKGGR